MDLECNQYRFLIRIAELDHDISTDVPVLYRMNRNSHRALPNQIGEQARAKPSPFEINSEHRCKVSVGTRLVGTVALSLSLLLSVSRSVLVPVSVLTKADGCIL